MRTSFPFSRTHVCAVTSAVRRFNVNPNQHRRNTQEFYSATKLTEYDIDKEKWGKQTQWHTMDCILDPNIDVPKSWSYKGVRKNISLWLSQKKITERRPNFSPAEELKRVYLDYKSVCFTPSANQQKDLCRVTTWTEAVRIDSEIKKLQLESEAKQAARAGKSTSVSWKDMSVKQTNAGTAKKGVTQKLPVVEPETKESATDKRPEGDVVPDIAVPLLELKVDHFDIINIYMGQMTNEDWIQITARVSGKSRVKTSPVFESFLEFPVFETKMGDGVVTTNQHPFKVVALMDRDGARYGKDGNDAAMLRKSLANAKTSWFGM
jgi:hypothetical protein